MPVKIGIEKKESCMDITYRSAAEADIPFLITARLRFIHAAEGDGNYPLLRESVERYFRDGFRDGAFDIVLAECDGRVVGTGMLFYYNSVPSQFNPWGKNAYITSMFVEETHRHRGIATGILDGLIAAAREKGYRIFLLNASDMGRPVYEKYGFQPGKAGMVFKLIV